MKLWAAVDSLGELVTFAASDQPGLYLTKKGALDAIRQRAEWDEEIASGDPYIYEFGPPMPAREVHKRGYRIKRVAVSL